MLNFYVEQSQGFGLGNFINCTPTIKALYKEHGEKIPVLFRQDYVKQCYINSPYIEIIESGRLRSRLFGSDMINRRNDCRDSDFIEINVLGATCLEDTFIDEVEPYKHGEPYGLFINGAGNHSEEYLQRKIVDLDTQQLIQELSPITVLGTGSEADAENNMFYGSYGDIRESLAMVAGASWVITNATGFYHVAGAYKKVQLCLWKDCKRPRNENINEFCINANHNEWKQKIIQFLK